jgi:2-methylcitrate dehydratase PrpD
VWEGTHGFLHAFANTTEGAWDRLTADFGAKWVISTIAFKPYACGTMIHPYIDCARRLAQKGLKAADIAAIECDTAEGIVHRLWEPLEGKRRPPNGYAAKFSIPYCVAYGLLRGPVGLEAFGEDKVRDDEVVALSQKVGYRVDPANPYPDNFTGHLRVRLRDGRVVEERQGHFRGGQHEPLPRAEIEEKFRANCAYGGWTKDRAGQWLALARGAFDGGPIDLKPFRG